MKKIFFFISLFIFSFGCKKRITPSEQHVQRLKFNENISKMFSMNVSPKYKKLIPILDETYANDQKYRDLTNNEYVQQNILEQLKLDSINQIAVGKIIDSFGYLSIRDIGIIGNKAINLVILHSPQSFKIKYFQIVKNAYSAKRMNQNTYAAFIDKYLIGMKKMQVFGTQLIKFKGKSMPYPIKFNLIDAYRNQLNRKLDLTSSFLVNKNKTIDSIEYVKYLPELIKFYKVDTASLDMKFIF